MSVRPFTSSAGMYRSMTSLTRYGGTSSSAEWPMIAAVASTTCVLYGRRYVISRRINRASYALPSTSSSCTDMISRRGGPRGPRLRGCQLLFEQLLAIELRVQSVSRHELVVRAALHDRAVVQYEDLIGGSDGGDPVRHDDGGARTHHARKPRQNLLFRIGVDGR